MIPSYYKSPNKDFTVIQGDCVDTLSKFQFGFDMVFADPPYFLSSGGISCQSGKVVCVNKGNWDKPTTPEAMDSFNLRWLKAVRNQILHQTFRAVTLHFRLSLLYGLGSRLKCLIILTIS